MKKLISLCVFLFTVCGWSKPVKPPQLIVILVVDQLRADQPLRYFNDFKETGLKKIFNQGSYLPFAEYPVLQNMTCPGHAMIATGSTPSSNKIPMNEWYDFTQKKIIPCGFDAQFGRSPKRLQGSTFGDEVRLRYPKSKVISLALKDRSAIMLGGHAATAAYWFDQEKNKWVSSDYYQNRLPHLIEWTHPKNPQNGDVLKFEPQLLAKELKFSETMTWGQSPSLAHPRALEQTFDFAKHLVTEYKLGQGSSPDILLISLSNHDIAGHLFGPDSAQSRETLALEDQAIGQFFNFLQTKIKGGLDKTWIALTADHGVAPIVEHAKQVGLSTGRIDIKSKIADWNQDLKKKFGLCRDPWIEATKSFHLFLNPECLSQLKPEAHSQMALHLYQIITKTEGIETIVACDHQLTAQHIIAPNISKRQNLSCVPGVSGQIILVPKPFWYELGAPATHMTHYSYDRFVPVVIWGQPFKAQVVKQKASVLDLTPTLLYGLGILPTANNEGEVLYSIFK